MKPEWSAKKKRQSPEIMPADGSDPAQRNRRGVRHVPAWEGQPQTRPQPIARRPAWQRV